MKQASATRNRAAAQPAAAASVQVAALSADEDGLRCLDGLRALSSVTVVLYHSWMGWYIALPYALASTLTRRNWFVRLAFVAGPLGVDFFMVVTAMLAAYQLVPLLEGGGKEGGGSSGSKGSSSSSGGKGSSSLGVVLGYWKRRALRMLPAYAVVNLLSWLALGPSEGITLEAASVRAGAFGGCPAGLWPNLVLIANYNRQGACGGHLWTVSLQTHFYLAFPLLLCVLRPRAPGVRARVAATLAAIFTAGTAWRLWAAFHSARGPSHLPLGDLANNPAELQGYLALWAAFFQPTDLRVAELAVGAALGLLLRSPAALSWLNRRRILLASAALAVQSIFVHSMVSWHHFGVPGEPLWQPHQTHLYTALLFWGSPFVALVVALTLLALVLRCDLLHAKLARVLSWRAFRPVSTLSYCSYLIHEHARLWTFLTVLPTGLLPMIFSVAPATGLAVLTAVTLAATYPAAYLLHVLVEKRF